MYFDQHSVQWKEENHWTLFYSPYGRASKAPFQIIDIVFDITSVSDGLHPLLDLLQAARACITTRVIHAYSQSQRVFVVLYYSSRSNASPIHRQVLSTSSYLSLSITWSSLASTVFDLAHILARSQRFAIDFWAWCQVWINSTSGNRYIGNVILPFWLF